MPIFRERFQYFQTYFLNLSVFQEARKEARLLALQELESEGTVSEDALKAQLGTLRVGASVTVGLIYFTR